MLIKFRTMLFDLIKLIGDGVSTLVTFGLTVLFMTLKPMKRGFFCEDSSIKYPYIEDEVTLLMLSIYFIFLPSIFIAGCECVLSFLEFRKLKLNILLNIYYYVNTFLFSVFLTTSIVYLAKCMIGRLSPNFITVCEPDKNCSLPMNKYNFMVDFECLKETSYEARTSFPSLHAALSFHSMVFLVVYIEVKIIWKGLHLIKTLFQAALIGSAVLISVTRITNHIHHWSDVFGGLLLGTSIALLSLLFCTDIILKNQRDEAKEED